MNATEFTSMLQSISFDSMPNEVIEKAKLCVLDYFGVLFAGQSMPFSYQLKEVLGGEKRIYSDPSNFAFWAGSISRIADLDDGHRFAMGHPGVPTISAAIASSMKKAVCGKDFIEAIVKGYEAYCLIGKVINPQAYQERGFDSTSICGAIGATVASGAICNLTENELNSAIGIAGSLCGGLTQYFEDGSSPKYLCSGWAASLGVMAVILAKGGFSGPSRILEGKNGFFQAFSPRLNAEYLNPTEIQWEINDVYFKKYGCVRRTHAALDCIESILLEENICYKDIEKIIVHGGHFLAEGAKYEPDNITSAQSSLPFSIAVLLYYGEINIELLRNGLNDKVISKLVHKVTILKDEEIIEKIKQNPSFWGAASVEIIDSKGGEYKRTAYIAKGERENPFDQKILDKKFMRLARNVLNEYHLTVIYNEIKKLEKSHDVSILYKYLQSNIC